MTGRLAILGGGGHGRVVADCAQVCGWEGIELFDDGPDVPRGPFPVVGTGADLLGRHGDYDGVVVAIGNNAMRLEQHQRLTAAGAAMAVLVHPAAVRSRHAVIGAGTVLLASAVVNVGAELGEAVIVNTGATVDHDCVLADGVHVAPGAHLAGGVRVGTESWIGLAAAVREYVRIGDRVFVGAGAIVVDTIPGGLTVIGCPARAVER